MNTAIATTNRKPNSPMSVFTICFLYYRRAFRGEPRHFAQGAFDLPSVPLLVLCDKQRPLVKIDLSKNAVRPLHYRKVEVRSTDESFAKPRTGPFERGKRFADRPVLRRHHHLRSDELRSRVDDVKFIEARHNRFVGSRRADAMGASPL